MNETTQLLLGFAIGALLAHLSFWVKDCYKDFQYRRYVKRVQAEAHERLKKFEEQQELKSRENFKIWDGIK